MKNTQNIKCTECGDILDQSPSNKTRSSLVCLNDHCGKWRQPQGSIECNNSKFFARPKDLVMGTLVFNIGKKSATHSGAFSEQRYK